MTVQIKQDSFFGISCCELGGCRNRATDKLIINERVIPICRVCGDILKAWKEGKGE